MKTCCCIYCGEERSVKGIHTHVDRTHLKLTKYSSGNNGKYKLISQNIIDKYNKNPKTCKECCCIIEYSKKSNNFCNGSCAATYNNRKKDYSKISSGPKGQPKFTKIEWLVCPETNKYFCNRNNKGRIIKNSPYLSNKRRKQYKGNKQLYDYRQQSLFKFNVYNYPEYFNLQLVEAHGWYKPVNKGNNLKGVSRDHMISVKYGFDNNIDPKIIAHPANCKLMLHSKNTSKNTNCSLTIEQLLDKISKWQE
jgi:hypothetical protein